MNLLLDTHVWLWWISEDPQLRPASVDILSSGENQLFVSSVSIWETAIKLKLNKTKPRVDLEVITQDPAITFIPFEINHAIRTENLPLYHQDPFDRALVAQAAQDGMTLVSANAKIKLYHKEVKILFC